MRFTEFNSVEPVVGDVLDLDLGSTLVEVTIVAVRNDGVIVEFDSDAVQLIANTLNEGKDQMEIDAKKMTLDEFVKKYDPHEEYKEYVTNFYYEARDEDKEVNEAKYQGREVPLGKPMAGDVKKSKVYVRGPKGNVVKVNFGDPNMKIKKSNPKRRKSFRARHNCANPGPRWKARYWSCRAW